MPTWDDVLTDTVPKHHQVTQSERQVIFASSLGTVFEWYDFYLFGLVATIFAAQFLTGLNPTTGTIMALLIFAAFYFLLIQPTLFDVAQILILNFWYSRYKTFYLFPT
jgi:hypothetical protein